MEVFLVKSGDYYDGMGVESVHKTQESAVLYVEKKLAAFVEPYGEKFIASPHITKMWVSPHSDDKFQIEKWEVKD